MIPLLLVRLGELRYAFYAQDVSEVLLCPSLRSFHSEKSMIDGFFKLGPKWVPVVSLASLMDKDPLEFGLFDVLVMTKTVPLMALRVSAVDGVRHFSWDKLKPLDSPVDGGASAAARLEVDSEPVLLLVASELLLEKERQLLTKSTELTAVREQRAQMALSQVSEEASR